MTQATDAAVAVLSRAPVPGAAKTRLVPLLGAEGAAQLQRRLVLRALETAAAAASGPVALFCAPDRGHPFFAECARRFGVALHDQTGGDLGARMHAACAALLAQAGRVLLIGSDCPALTPAHLARANNLLDSHDAVVWPAEDGGYVLIALRRAEQAVFEGVDWGTPRVMAQTRERLQRLGWRWAEPEPLWDVDFPADYARMVAAGLVDPVAA